MSNFALPGRKSGGWWSRLTLRQSDSLLGYMLVMPLLVCIVMLVVYPFVFAVWISFTDKTVGSTGEFIGLGNYLYLINQPSFTASIVNTVVLVTAMQLLKLVFGLGIAVLLNQPIRARQFWRGLVLLPWAMPAFVAFITWKLLFDPQGGAFNYILLQTHVVDRYVDFLSTKELAMPSVIVASFWRGFPFWVISFLAAMQAIPRSCTSRRRWMARMPGSASGISRLPSMRHVILVVVLISTIATTNSFEAVWLMTGGGPSNATMTFPVLAYYGLQSLQIGQAAAVSVAMLPVFAVLALIVAVQLQKED